MTHPEKIAKFERLAREEAREAQLLDLVIFPDEIQQHKQMAALFAEAAAAWRQIGNAVEVNQAEALVAEALYGEAIA